jgi:DNA adenine methylase
MDEVKARPFLKWVGGKSQLIDQLIKRLPKKFNTYYEPFLGGGALFFYLKPKTAVLSDVNPDLIDTYCAIRDEVEMVIDELSLHKYDKEYYYKVRSWDRIDSYLTLPRAKRAARVIYLNKTCFNGLYRVNSNGYFNVPFGKYKNPTILDIQNLNLCSQRLKYATIKNNDYKHIVVNSKEGDFVYFDPPYMPISETSSFTSYSKDGFLQKQQIELMETCKILDQKRVYFMLSNSAVPFIYDIYKEFDIEKVPATRSINSVASKRGPVEEVIIRNF